MHLNFSNITLDDVLDKSLPSKGIELLVLRIDKIHPVVSGNKLFKLHYFLLQAKQDSFPGLLTFGGAYSNHLVATAFACQQQALPCVGIVRGEKPEQLSPTLQACMEYGMQLHFISRTDYAQKEAADFIQNLPQAWQKFLVVPEGGYHPNGAVGAALIAQCLPEDCTHICTAIGTATTFAGILQSAKAHQQVIGIPVLKGMTDIAERLQFLNPRPRHFEWWDGYHFGGYAKKTPALLDFMNELYRNHRLPTDFVYTAKMLFAVMDKIAKGHFASGSKIVCLHTGGLQGNASLPEGSLLY